MMKKLLLLLSVMFVVSFSKDDDGKPTCTSCKQHVNNEVNKFNEIVNSKALYENGYAIIELDRTKINEIEIEKAIDSIGYKVTDKQEN